MNSQETITTIYSAILDDGLWQPALDSLAKDLGAQSSLLLHSDVNDNVPFRIQRGSQLWSELDEETLAHYESKLGHYESDAWNFLQHSPQGTIAVDTDFACAELLRARPDYQFSIKYLDLCHRASMRLNGSDTWFEALTIHFSPNIRSVPYTSRSILTGLLPHVAKARECSVLFRLLQRQYHTTLNALDHVDIGLCIVNSNAEVILKNKAAEEIISNSSGVRVSTAGVFEFKGNDALFNEAVKRCAEAAVGENTTAEVILHSADRFCGNELIVEISPFRDSSGELEKSMDGALVTLIDSSHSKKLDSERVAKAYKLSKAESSVLNLLVQGSTNCEIAEKRNVSVETVKSQVNSIYLKSGTRKRSDLIRLAAKISPPVH